MEIVLMCLAAIFMGAGGLQFLERMLVKAISPPSPAPALEPAKKPEAYECEVYSERLLDEKMVEAKIMTRSDMAVCDNLECPNCKPSRPEGFGLREFKALSERNEDLKKNSAQKKRLLEKAKEEMRNRGAHEAYPKPPEVPWNATRVQHYDPVALRDEIIWQWIDEKGSVRALRQFIAPQFQVNVYSDQSIKPIQRFNAGRIDTERIKK